MRSTYHIRRGMSTCIKKISPCLLLLWSLLSGPDIMASRPQHFPVVLAGDTLVVFGQGREHLSAADRADLFQRKIDTLCFNKAFSRDSVRIVNTGNSVDLHYGNAWLVSLVPDDTLANNKGLIPLALDIKGGMQYVPDKVLSQDLKKTLVQTLLVVVVVLLAFLIVWLIGKVYRWTVKRVENSSRNFFGGVKIQNLEVINRERQFRLVVLALQTLRVLITVLLIYMVIPVVFSLFPETNHIAGKLFGYIFQPITALLNGFFSFLPSFVTIVVVVVFVRYLLKFLRYLCIEIKEDRIHITGFYPEWAMPTYNIIRFAVVAFTFIIVFPFLPGSDSPIFIGALAFFGFLVAMGSTHAVGNFISGLVITYMRPFQIGDRVKVGDTSGEVVDKTLLVTRIQTKYNEVVTIPNAELLKDHTINYSSSQTELGLIIYTTVRIPIEYPWRDVEKHLIEAVSHAEGVLENPRPFVLKRNIEEGAVEYQVNAYSQASIRLARVKSAMNQAILDEFAEAGIPVV